MHGLRVDADAIGVEMIAGILMLELKLAIGEASIAVDAAAAAAELIANHKVVECSGFDRVTSIRQCIFTPYA